MSKSNSCDKLFKRIDEPEKEYIDFWIDTAAIESPTEYKEGVDRAGNCIINI